MDKEPNLSFYLAIVGRILRFILFPGVSKLCEIQAAPTRIWTRIAHFIFIVDDHYTTYTIIVQFKCIEISSSTASNKEIHSITAEKTVMIPANKAFIRWFQDKNIIMPYSGRPNRTSRYHKKKMELFQCWSAKSMQIQLLPYPTQFTRHFRQEHRRLIYFRYQMHFLLFLFPVSDFRGCIEISKRSSININMNCLTGVRTP